jgi:fatty-acyl-CoA synthase
VRGLMMDIPLTVDALLRRAETQYGTRAVVTRDPAGGARSTTYAEVADRARRVGAALAGAGVEPGDRVATLCMNHQEHLELYFGVPAIGGVLHTMNPRLPPEELGFIASHAGDRVIVVDEGLLPALAAFRDDAPFEQVIVIGEAGEGDLTYDELIGGAPGPAPPREAEEGDAAALCYTSGTTGAPKGVLYSHRALVLHSLASALGDVLDIREADVVMPVVPMFHVNAWGLPFTSAMVGAGLVLPGPRLDPESLLAAISEHGVTVSAGVPTVWLGALQLLDDEPGRFDVSRLRSIIIGGSAAPEAMIAALQERHGLSVLHAWGMTEMTPVGSVSRLPPDVGESAGEALGLRAKQGRAVPLVEMRARGDDGLVARDGVAMGELEVRGPAVARAYFDGPPDDDRFTDDGWFRTGDIVTIDPRGFMEITDRSKDLVKSGGEWISSVALENALMGHPAVGEACVVGVPHPRWVERPLACVVLKPGMSCEPEELRAHLEERFPRWWLPEGIEFVDAIPRTATGKFKKADLRERYRGHFAG